MNIWNVNIFITFILNTDSEINSAFNIEKDFKKETILILKCHCSFYWQILDVTSGKKENTSSSYWVETTESGKMSFSSHSQCLFTFAFPCTHTNYQNDLTPITSNTELRVWFSKCKMLQMNGTLKSKNLITTLYNS